MNSSDINPEIGITGTPTIDLSAERAVRHHEDETDRSGQLGEPHSLRSHAVQDQYPKRGRHRQPRHRQHRRFLRRNERQYVPDANERSDPNQDPFVFGSGSGAVSIGGQSRVYFNALRQMSRPGIDLVNGQIYTFWASHGDNGNYHGWMLRFDENTLALTAALNTTPNGGLGGIWQGGGIASVDTHLDASGNPMFYFETGNGTFDGSNGTDGARPCDGTECPRLPRQWRLRRFVRQSRRGHDHDAGQPEHQRLGPEGAGLFFAAEQRVA